MDGLFKRVRTILITGVLVIVPIAVTWWVLVFLVGFLEKTIKLLPDALEPQNLVGFPIPGLGVLLAVATVFTVGFTAQSFAGRRVLDLYEWMMLKVPIVSSIHAGVKQLVEALFASDKGHFRQVVLVEYPRKGIFCVAFHTGESFVHRAGEEPLVNVFLPTTPNPTSGFYLMIPADDVHMLDLTVEEAFKLIMSAGIVSPTEARELTAEVSRDELEAILARQGETLESIGAGK